MKNKTIFKDDIKAQYRVMLCQWRYREVVEALQFKHPVLKKDFLLRYWLHEGD